MWHGAPSIRLPIVPETSPRESLAQIALAELAHRVAQGEAAIRARRHTAAQVQALLRPWAAIAAYVGADVSDLLVPEPGVYRSAHPEERPQGASRRAAHPEEAEGRLEGPSWIDFCPPRTRADEALRSTAREAREAWHRLATRAEAARDPAHPEHERAAQLATRAAGLARLEQHLTTAAGIPAYQPANPEPDEGPETKPAEQVAA